jgi:hypothetical protein
MCKMASLAIFSVNTVGPLFGRKKNDLWNILQSTEYRVQSADIFSATFLLLLSSTPAQPAKEFNVYRKILREDESEFWNTGECPILHSSFFYVLPLYYYTVLFVIVHRYSYTVHHLLYCCEISSPFRFTEVSFSVVFFL